MSFYENFAINGGKLPNGEFTKDATLYLATWDTLGNDMVSFFRKQHVKITLIGFDPAISYSLNGTGYTMPVELALAIQESSIQFSLLKGYISVQ